MTRFRVAVTCLVVAAGAANAECPPCGDMQCVGERGFAAKKASKKKKLAENFPAEWVNLVDKDGACDLCLENAPDWFTLLLVKPNGSLETKTWTKELEQYAKQDLHEGKLKAAYAVYVRRRCPCCKEKRAEELPDWDATLELSKSLAVPLK